MCIYILLYIYSISISIGHSFSKCPTYVKKIIKVKMRWKDKRDVGDIIIIRGMEGIILIYNKGIRKKYKEQL